MAMDAQEKQELLASPEEEEQVTKIEEQLAAAAISNSFLLPKTGSDGYLGKHRMAAAVSHLQNQINFIQEELDQLESLGESSIVCRELISNVDSIPDPLLPVTKGPTIVAWDQWFRGAPNSRRRWI